MLDWLKTIGFVILSSQIGLKGKARLDPGEGSEAYGLFNDIFVELLS